MPRHPSDPDFPHGELRGYKAGCTPRTYDCPADPSCDTAHHAYQRARVARRDPNRRPGDAQTSHVVRRLNETLANASLPAAAARAGLTVDQIEAVLDYPYITMPRDLADPLDYAWAWYVHGIDTKAPGFPHGTPTGYGRKCCRCRPCTSAQNRTQNRRRAGIPADHEIITVPGLAAHAQQLIAVAGAAAAARAAGISTRGVLIDVAGGARARRRIARQILATTPFDCARAARTTAADRARFYARTMQALGYPLSWQARQDPRLTLHKIQKAADPDTVWVRVETETALASIAKRVGDTPAGPEHGIDQRHITGAQTNAARAGWYPPKFYDDRGVLDHRAIPGHPWSQLDVSADTKLRALRLTVTHGCTQTQVATEVGASTQSVYRWTKDAGLSSVNGVIDHAAHGDVIRRICDTYTDYEGGRIGPVAAAITLGVIDPGSKFTPQDHPEVVAWRDARTREDQAA